MTRLRGTSRVIGWVLIAVGVVGAGAFLLHWGQCFGGLTEGCYAATQSDFTWTAMAALWIIAFPLTIVGAFVFSPAQPITLLGVALLMLINPLTDRGLFFVPWDVADTLPFTGMTIALAAIAAGMFQFISARRLMSGAVTSTSGQEPETGLSDGEAHA